MRQAIDALEKAIALDPKFSLAYARLSIAHSDLHWVSVDSTQEISTKAQIAADKALALDPSLPEGHLALAFIHYHIHFKLDDALRELSIVERSRPNDFDALWIKGTILRRQGKFHESITSIERAIEIEPRIGKYLVDQAGSHLILREYDKAERLLDRALAVTPHHRDTWLRALRWKANIAIDRDGDVAKAVRIARQKFAAQPNRDSAALDVLANSWPATADPELRRAALDLHWKPGMGEKVNLFARKMAIHSAFGDRALARIYAESTLVLMKRVTFSPTNAAGGYELLARTHAILGNRAPALEAQRKAIALRPLSLDAVSGPELLQNRAVTLTILEDHDAAIDELEKLLKMPSFLSKNRLRLFPGFDPLRSNPRFQRLVSGE